MLTVVIGVFIFANFVVCPLILCLSARILRIKNVTIWRTYLCFLLLGVAEIVGFALSLLRFPGHILLLLVLALGLLVLLPMIVRWVFHTTFWRTVVCLLLFMVICVGLAFGIRAVAVEAFVVPTGGMSPTIMAGEKLWADKITSHFRGFYRGEIVAFYSPPDPKMRHIKRIAAVAGDRIEVREGILYVNGAASGKCPLLDRPYPDMTPPKLPCTVPAGKLFLLGDNRDNSLDSRHYGFVDVQSVVGIAVIVYASVELPLDPYERQMLQKEGKDPDKTSHPNRIRWERIGTILK
jgi:signal peptidase I